MFDTAVTLKQQKALQQRYNHTSGDRQHKECEVLKESGQTVIENSGQSDTEPKVSKV